MHRDAQNIRRDKASARALVPAWRNAAYLAALYLIFVGLAEAEDREYGSPQFLAAEFVLPAGIAYDPPRDRVFVVTAGNHRIVYATATDAVTAPLGSAGGWTVIGEVADRADTAALNEPQGIAVDANGNVYVADTFNNRARLYRYNSDTDTYALDPDFTGDAPNTADGTAIDRPRDIAVGAEGAVYLLDSGNRRILRATGPDARSWDSYHTGTDWSHAFGLDVTAAGDVYIADTDNHRIVRVRPDGSEETFGRFGRYRGSLRYPRDIAVGDDGRLYVADTHNHRIAIFDATFTYYRSLGGAPLIRNPESLALGPGRQLFIADIERKDILAYLGPSATPQFDGFIRDSETDEGDEPFPEPDASRAPDIIVRGRPDVDLNRAAVDGFERIGSEAVIPEGEYFLYFTVNNRGIRPFPPGALRVFTSTIDDAAPYYLFPDEWMKDETFKFMRGVASTTPQNLLRLPEIGPSVTGSLGRKVVGPLIWRPEATTTSCDSALFVMARVLNIHDPIIINSNDGFEQARNNNNIAVKRVPFVASNCIPEADRYETNDEAETAAEADEDWTHLHARCPRRIARRVSPGASYPDVLCENIFEDANWPSIVPPHAAEEIWTMEISNLSLHSMLDRDFFRVPLPQLDDPRYQLNDINPVHIREAFADAPGYEPAVMPECGPVKRRGPGPGGAADRTVWINVRTELTIEAIPEGPPQNSIAPRPIDASGEELHGYMANDGGYDRDNAVFSGSRFIKHVTCPQDLHNLRDVLFSFGERETIDGIPSPRELLATGGYKLSITYLSSIERGVPSWVAEPEIAGEVTRLDCFGIRPFSGGRFGASAEYSGMRGGLGISVFPFCGPGGSERFGFFEQHPRILKTPDCIADGPGCLSIFFFYWPGGHIPFDVAFAGNRGLTFSLIEQSGQAITETQISPNMPPTGMGAFENIDLSSLKPANGSSELMGGHLRLDSLPAGYYGLMIKGRPSEFALSFKALSVDDPNLPSIKDRKVD